MTRALVGMLVLVLSGCGTPLIECSEDLGTPKSAAVTGTMKTSSGAPLAGKTVTFQRESTFDLFQPGFHNDFSRDVTTSSEGTFSLPLQDSEMANGLSIPLTFNALIAEGNDTAGYSFRVHKTKVRAPLLQPWKSSLASEGTTVTWSDLVAQQPELASPSYELMLANGSPSNVPPVWKEKTSETSRSFAAQSLEDFKNMLATVVASSRSCSDGSVFSLTHKQAAGVPLTDGSTVPVSRGAACTADTAKADTAPCVLTNGDPQFSAFENQFDGDPAAVTLDLGSAKSVKRAVIRDLTAKGSNLIDDDGKRPDHRLRVELSTDGSTFTPAVETLKLTDPATKGCFSNTTLTECWLDLDFGGAKSARYLRLTLELAGTPPMTNGAPLAPAFATLTQVSLFE